MYIDLKKRVKILSLGCESTNKSNKPEKYLDTVSK